MRAWVLLLVGCDAGARSLSNDQPTLAHAMEPAPSPSDLTVHLKYRRCNGTWGNFCLVYEVDIAADGRVHFVPDVEGRPREAGTPINRERMRALDEMIDAAGFFQLDNEYGGCKPAWRQRPETVITISRNGRTKAVERYDGCQETLPLVLEKLEGAIDLAAGTTTWLGHRYGLQREWGTEKEWHYP